MVNWGSKFPLVIYRESDGTDHTAIVVDVTDPVTGNANILSLARNGDEALKCLGYDPPNENVVFALPGSIIGDIPTDPNPSAPSTRHWRPFP